MVFNKCLTAIIVFIGFDWISLLPIPPPSLITIVSLVEDIIITRLRVVVLGAHYDWNGLTTHLLNKVSAFTSHLGYVAHQLGAYHRN